MGGQRADIGSEAGRPDFQSGTTGTAGSVLVSRLFGLASVAADLAGAPDLAAVSRIVTASSAEVLGADMAGLYALEPPDTLSLLGLRDHALNRPEFWRPVPVGEAGPVGEAARTGQLVTAGNRAEMDRRWPGAFEDSSERSVVAIPLLSEGTCIGVIGLSFPMAQEFSDADRRYLGALGDCCAQAMARIRATRSAAESARKLSFLAEASEVLARSLDYEDTLRNVADLAVPDLADWCSIELLEEGTLRQVAISHVDPTRVELARRLREVYPPDMDAQTGTAAVVRTGRSELYPVIDVSVLDAVGLEAERRQVVEDLELSSAVTVPLAVRGRVLGALTLVYAESGRHYDQSDVAFAEDVARRAALAIDNAQLHTETLQVALQLQRAILPESFPDSETWQVAAHYRPAGRTEVGGDFYDALTLPDQRLVALVGDVMGRGVQAAAAMAQTRAALRAYIAIDPEPEEVLGRLDRMFRQMDLPELVTVLYALIDLPAGRARMVSAGHLPPLLVRGDGSVQRLERPASPPLGLVQTERPVVTVDFGPSDLLLLYSDGLVERRGEDLEEGLQRLTLAASGLAGRVGDRRLAALADSLRQAGHDDDVTLLAVRPVEG